MVNCTIKDANGNRKFYLIINGVIVKTLYTKQLQNAYKQAKRLVEIRGKEEFIIWDIMSGIVYIYGVRDGQQFKIAKRKKIYTRGEFEANICKITT